MNIGISITIKLHQSKDGIYIKSKRIEENL